MDFVCKFWTKYIMHSFLQTLSSMTNKTGGEKHWNGAMKFFKFHECWNLVNSPPWWCTIGQWRVMDMEGEYLTVKTNWNTYESSKMCINPKFKKFCILQGLYTSPFCQETLYISTKLVLLSALIITATKALPQRNLEYFILKP